MSLLTFRMAGLADSALLARMNRQLIVDEGSDNPMNEAELEARMRQFLQTDWLCAIFEVERAIAGYALYQLRPQLHDTERQEVFLRQFFIADDFRRKGIGRAGIELLETEAFPPGAPVILDVLSANARGEQFWRSVGFEPYVVTMRKQ